MRVMLDGQCVVEQADSLRDALAAASNRAEELGRLILEVNADGEPLPPQSLEAPEDHSGSIGELALVSADPQAFALNILHESADAVDQTLKLQVDAANKMEQGEPQDSFEALSAGLSMWDMVQQAIARTREIAPPAEAQLAARVDDHITQLRDQLLSVRGSIESQDWAALGDTLRFDLADLGTSWSSLLREWADGLPRTKPKPNNS